MSLISLFTASEGMLSQPASISLGIASSGLMQGATAPIVLVDGHDGHKRRRDQEETDWEAYRRKQRELRDTLEDVYAKATGREVSAETIIDLPKPPKQKEIRKLLSRIRELDALIAREASLYTEAAELQDEEDSTVILLLH